MYLITRSRLSSHRPLFIHGTPRSVANSQFPDYVFGNVRYGGGLVTEQRVTNFSMEILHKPAVQLRKGGRHADIVSAPLPKRV